MTDLQIIWRQMNYIEPFDEQSSPALEVMDCGIAVGRTPAGLPIRPDYSDELIEDSWLSAGCLE